MRNLWRNNLKAYIISSLKNCSRVIELRDKLATHDIYLTYDWAEKYHENEPVAEWEKIAKEEVLGVFNADVVVAILPAGRGGHFELGLAYGWKKKVFMLTDGESEIAFHTLMGIKKFSDEASLIEALLHHRKYF